jgi:hypothetical protein
MRVTFHGLAAAALLAACSPGPNGDAEAPVRGPAGLPAELRAITGARTRVVWVQGDGTDPQAAGLNLVLMGLDTDDARGERVILGERRSYVKPLITRAGNRLVFSSRPDPGPPEVFVINWDGSGLKRLAAGFALAVWQDPADGREWVYTGTDHQKYDFATVSRFLLDDPGIRELVWNRTMVSSDTFQVSADGRSAAGLFPWPEVGVAELPNRSWRRLGDGCWTSLTDAGGRLLWYFDGAHQNLTLIDLGTDRRWVVPINRPPGFRNAESYHPRWSNHPRFMVMSGPYSLGTPGENQVRAGGAQTEVYVGRFSPDFTNIEAWARVTDNSGGDSFPDAWIDRDRSPRAVRPPGPIGPQTSALPSPVPAARPAGARVVLEARLVEPGPIPSPQSIAPYRHALSAGVYDVVRVVEGSHAGPRVRAAHWTIRDGRVLADARRTVGSLYRLTLELYDDHPELEGERLLTGRDAPELPLYYEVRVP